MATHYKWKAHKAMPTKRVFCVASQLGDNLYVVGGCDAKGHPLDSLEVYLSAKEQWKVLPHMPTKRAAPCVATVGKKLVVIGGVSSNQQPLDVVEVYNAEDRKWSSGETLKDKLLGLSCVIREGRVIIVGGMSIDTNPKDHMMSYDLETDRWQSLPSMPTARYACFTFLIRDKLYVLGGRQGKVPVTAFEVFDFADSTWRKLPNIPSKRVFALYTHSDTHIYSLGGLKETSSEGFSDVTEVFDIEKETWHIGKPMTTKRGDFAVGFIGDKVIVAGGLGNQGRPLVETESYDQSTDTWTAEGSLPTAHCSCAYTTLQGRLHVIGGLSTGGPTGAVESLIYKK